MNLFILEDWCSRAVRGIHYPPDRNDVYSELYLHVQDRYKSFLAKGFPEEEAKGRTVAAMGDPDEIAPQLAKIHNSLWPYIAFLFKWVTAAVLVVTLFSLMGYFVEKNRQFELPDDRCYAAGYVDGMGKRSFYAEPNASVELDGYKVAVTKVAERFYSQTDGDTYFLYFRVEITSPFGVTEGTEPEMYRWFWVEDSLGNQYGPLLQHDVPYVSWVQKKEMPLRCVVDMSLGNYVSQDAQWLDVHYERDGRKVTLRIPLTGGVAS